MKRALFEARCLFDCFAVSQMMPLTWTPTNVHPAADNPALLEMAVNIAPNKEWLNQLRSGLQALGSAGPSVYCEQLQKNTCDRWRSNVNFVCSVLLLLSPRAETTQMCIMDNDKATSYSLPLGDYSQEFKRIFGKLSNRAGLFGMRYLVAVLRFSNRAQTYKSDCFPVKLPIPFFWNGNFDIFRWSGNSSTQSTGDFFTYTVRPNVTVVRVPINT